MKIKLLAAVLIWFCGFGNAVFAQKENYVWYFGDHAGLDFNSGSVMPLTNSSMVSREGCSSISDPNGNLLFYTNGRRVWNRNDTQMPNGYALGSGGNVTQSALIIPDPGNNSLFYIFSVQNYSSYYHNFSYSVVDMSLDNGDGDVTIKDSIVFSPVTEKLTACKMASNSGYWVMVHENGSNSFYAYSVTATGISSVPVISNIGINIFGTCSTGYMKFSPDGTKLALVVCSNVELFDFNSFTGNVSNEKLLTIPPPAPVYGVEFSPTGHFLYSARAPQPAAILQWDITSNIESVINSTLQQIPSNAYYLHALQLGPDGKIYVTHAYTNFLGVINYPDSVGLFCQYSDSSISLNTGNSIFGLPNFMTSYFLPTGINTNNPHQNRLTISPNPATDKITISFPSTTSGNITVKIYSITGEVVFEEKNKSATPITNFQFPIFNLTNGIYFLSVQTGREVVTKKIVVNH